MSSDLKITKCVALPSHVIVYFSQALDVTATSNPSLMANYSIQTMVPAAPPAIPVLVEQVPITGASYDVINRAAVLQLGKAQKSGQWLAVDVKGVASSNNPIATPNNTFQVQVNSEVAPPPPSSPPPTPVGRSEEQLRKVLQPSYAIGMGVISQDDYTNLKNEYFAQCELSLGLIIPLILIVLGLVLTPQIKLQGTWWVVMCLAMVPISTVLFLVGAERYHKYRMELKLLILGNWQKLQDAKKAASTANGTKKTPQAPANPTPPIAVNPLVVEVHMQTQPEKPAQTAVELESEGQPTTTPETAGASGQGKPSERGRKLPNGQFDFENESGTELGRQS
jgi:hypothetical protein